MSTQHVFKFNGYHTSEERLLEDVMFEVHITEGNGDLVIDRIANPSNNYLDKFNEDFFDTIHAEIRARVQEDIDHLRKYAADNGRTLSQELDVWDGEKGADQERIDLLGEV